MHIDSPSDNEIDLSPTHVKRLLAMCHEIEQAIEEDTESDTDMNAEESNHDETATLDTYNAARHRLSHISGPATPTRTPRPMPTSQKRRMEGPLHPKRPQKRGSAMFSKRSPTPEWTAPSSTNNDATVFTNGSTASTDATVCTDFASPLKRRQALQLSTHNLLVLHAALHDEIAVLAAQRDALSSDLAGGETKDDKAWRDVLVRKNSEIAALITQNEELEGRLTAAELAEKLEVEKRVQQKVREAFESRI